MKLEELIEILKAYGAVLGWNHFVSLLKGEETITEYIAGVTQSHSEHLKEIRTELEEERKKENPNEYHIEGLQDRINTIVESQLRISEYLTDKNKAKREEDSV